MSITMWMLFSSMEKSVVWKSSVVSIGVAVFCNNILNIILFLMVSTLPASGPAFVLINYSVARVPRVV